jgi:hypothetical protein
MLHQLEDEIKETADQADGLEPAIDERLGHTNNFIDC